MSQPLCVGLALTCAQVCGQSFNLAPSNVGYQSMQNMPYQPYAQWGGFNKYPAASWNAPQRTSMMQPQPFPGAPPPDAASGAGGKKKETELQMWKRRAGQAMKLQEQAWQQSDEMEKQVEESMKKEEDQLNQLKKENDKLRSNLESALKERDTAILERNAWQSKYNTLQSSSSSSNSTNSVLREQLAKALVEKANLADKYAKQLMYVRTILVEKNITERLKNNLEAEIATEKQKEAVELQTLGELQSTDTELFAKVQAQESELLQKQVVVEQLQQRQQGMTNVSSDQLMKQRKDLQQLQLQRDELMQLNIELTSKEKREHHKLLQEKKHEVLANERLKGDVQTILFKMKKEAALEAAKVKQELLQQEQSEVNRMHLMQVQEQRELRKINELVSKVNKSEPLSPSSSLLASSINLVEE